MINHILFILACITSSFVNTANARAKASNNVIFGGLTGMLADIAWLIIFKDLIAGNVLDIHGMIFYVDYVIGYGLGRVLSQHLLIKYAKGSTSVGGAKLLEKRVKTLEKLLTPPL